MQVNRGIGLLVLVLCFAAMNATAQNATSENYAVQIQAQTGGTAQANSDSFSLQSCISLSPGGVSSSESFNLHSGCAVLFLKKDEPAQSPASGEAGRIDSPAPVTQDP